MQIIYDPFNGFLDVVESSPTALVMINGGTNQLVATLNFSVSDEVIAANPNNGELYAASGGEEFFDFRLVALNGSTGTVVSSVLLNGTPQAITYDGGNGQLYVVATQYGFGGYENGTVTEVNSAATRVEGEWEVGQLPGGIAYDDSNEDLYVTSYCSTNVSIVNASSRGVTGSISTEGSPGPIVYDAMNRCLYTVHIEGLVSILAPPGSSCPTLPVPALNALLVLSAGGFVGLTMAAVVFHSWMIKKEKQMALELENGSRQGASGK